MTPASMVSEKSANLLTGTLSVSAVMASALEALVETPSTM